MDEHDPNYNPHLSDDFDEMYVAPWQENALFWAKVAVATAAAFLLFVWGAP